MDWGQPLEANQRFKAGPNLPPLSGSMGVILEKNRGALKEYTQCYVAYVTILAKEVISHYRDHKHVNKERPTAQAL